MNRHFLLTLGSDVGAFAGVHFVSWFFQAKERIEITLYSAVPLPCGLGEYAGREERQEYDRLYAQREHGGLETLRAARDALLGQGFDPQLVHEKLAFRRSPAAADILLEGEHGLYDAVILGRRGLTWVEELIESSVSREIMRHALDFPLWICRHPERGRKNVLVCVDDSEPAYRMVDHVGFILAAEPEHSVTLLNVFDPESGDRVFADGIFEHCKTILRRNELEPGRIHTRMVESFNVVKSVLRVADSGNYAVVAAGRTGEDYGRMRRLFMGTVSTELYRRLTGAVLWLSR